MTRIAVVLLAGLALAGCNLGTLEQRLQRAREIVRLVNSSAISIEEVVREACPTIQKLNAGATAIACVAKASGERKDRIAKVSEYGDRFCRNPTSKSLADMMNNAKVGLEAAIAVTAAECPTL
jgi:hypothetical protein